MHLHDCFEVEAVSSVSSFEDASAEEPGCLADIEKSNHFQSLMMAIIGLNTFAMASAANYPDEPYWETVDNAFLVVFTGEILLRLLVHGWNFFCNKDRGWNWFDFTIVFAGVVDQWVLSLVRQVREGNPRVSSALMPLRVMRILRVLRALRLIRQFKVLTRLAQGIIDSFQSVFWIGMMFFMLILVSAIFVTQWAGQQPDEFEDPSRITYWFGTVPSSMGTLFIFLTCDDWSTPARMVNARYPWMRLFWIWYMVTGAFLLLSLLTGLVADKMNQTRLDQEVQERNNQERLEELAEKLRILFDQADETRDARVDRREFRDMISDRHVRAELERCGCHLNTKDLSEVNWIFDSLDADGNGYLTWNEFHDAIIRLCMSPKDSLKDVIYLEADIVKLDRKLKHATSLPLRRKGALTWDDRVDSLHARASLVRERLMILERDARDFFEVMEYRRKAGVST